MKRRARCWVCGLLFEADRGSLPKGARFACGECVADGLQPPDGAPPDHRVLARVLYERHGVPYADLREVAVEEPVLRLVAEEFALHHAVLPLSVRAAGPRGRAGRASRSGPAPGRAIVLAMCDPGNAFAIESVKRRTGLAVQPVVSTWAEIVEAIEEQYLRVAVADGPATDPE